MGQANCCGRETDDTQDTFVFNKLSNEERIAMVIKIQKVFRGYLARKRVGEIARPRYSQQRLIGGI